MNKKKSILIISLIVLFGALLFSFLYRELNKLEKDNKSKTINEKISKDDLEKYLNYVPFEYDSHVIDCSRNSIDDCTNVIKYFDAYSNEKVTINDINDELLLRKAILNTKNVANTDSFESDFPVCGDSKTCILDDYYKGESVKNKIKEMYNKDIELKEISVGGGYAYYKNGYYAVWYGAGNYPPTKVNKIIDYNISNNELTITEQAIFMYDETVVMDGKINITKTTNYKENDIIKSFEYGKNSTYFSILFKKASNFFKSVQACFL